MTFSPQEINNDFKIVILLKCVKRDSAGLATFRKGFVSNLLIWLNSLKKSFRRMGINVLGGHNNIKKTSAL